MLDGMEDNVHRKLMLEPEDTPPSYNSMNLWRSRN
jgi:hypothetical protein